jgi:hypothetical protein
LIKCQIAVGEQFGFEMFHPRWHSLATRILGLGWLLGCFGRLASLEYTKWPESFHLVKRSGQ